MMSRLQSQCEWLMVRFGPTTLGPRADTFPRAVRLGMTPDPWALPSMGSALARVKAEETVGAAWDCFHRRACPVADMTALLFLRIVLLSLPCSVLSKMESLNNKVRI